MRKWIYCCKRCGNTVRDEIVPERCATCGAPVRRSLRSYMPRNWRFTLGIVVIVTVIVPLVFW